jgi:hypothetical protein
MARPRIGIFGALMAVGGLLALHYVQQRNRAAQIPATRELSRWEGEGGAVATPASATESAVTAVPAASVAPATPNNPNGSPHHNGSGGAWPFPRS